MNKPNKKIMKKWTKKDVQKLIYMKNYNYTLKEIADILSITINAASKALYRYHEGYIKLQEKKNANKNHNDQENKNDDSYYTITNKKVVTINGAVKYFNSISENKIFFSDNNEYTYRNQRNLSSISALIIINTFLKKFNLSILHIYNFN